MNPSICLSRLAITGSVTLSTPLVVLKEIADSHSIKYNEKEFNNQRYLVKFLNGINITPVKLVKTPYERKDYVLIAGYINRKIKWPLKPLKQAFNFLLTYTNIEKLTELPIDFIYGPQTPDNPHSLNACVLYGICKANKIDTRSNTTIEDMVHNIKLLSSLRDPEIHTSIQTIITDSIANGTCDGYQLINILTQINQRVDLENIKIKKIVITYEDMRTAGEDILHRRGIRSLPITHTEAVVMAALYYKMDITNVINPLAEYQELSRPDFDPIDKDLSRRLLLSFDHPGSLDNPRLDKVFNPNIPSNIYNENDLTTLCIEEGYQSDDIEEEGPYTLLQTSCFLSTFFHGKQGNITNTETTMLEEISEMEYDNIVIYGIRDSDVVGYTYGELLDTFKNTKLFQNPSGNNELFEDITINKLKLLCDRHRYINESHDSYLERAELSQEIEKVKMYQQNNDKTITNFIQMYLSYDSNYKNLIDEFLTLLLHSAMYMRGWSGKGPYPLKTSDCAVSNKDSPIIRLRVTQSIQRLDASILFLNNNLLSDEKIGDMVKDLPLFLYNNTSKELNKSTRIEEGLTIYERINIVKGGESGSIHACIRMSSNRFAASAYFYMGIIGMDLPFDITQLSHIL